MSATNGSSPPIGEALRRIVDLEARQQALEVLHVALKERQLDGERQMDELILKFDRLLVLMEHIATALDFIADRARNHGGPNGGA